MGAAENRIVGARVKTPLPNSFDSNPLISRILLHDLIFPFYTKKGAIPGQSVEYRPLVGIVEALAHL